MRAQQPSDTQYMRAVGALRGSESRCRAQMEQDEEGRRKEDTGSTREICAHT